MKNFFISHLFNRSVSEIERPCFKRRDQCFPILSNFDIRSSFFYREWWQQNGCRRQKLAVT